MVKLGDIRTNADGRPQAVVGLTKGTAFLADIDMQTGAMTRVTLRDLRRVGKAPVVGYISWPPRAEITGRAP